MCAINTNKALHIKMSLLETSRSKKSCLKVLGFYMFLNGAVVIRISCLEPLY